MSVYFHKSAKILLFKQIVFKNKLIFRTLTESTGMWDKSFQKLSVVKLTSNFAEAVKVVKEPLIEPGDNEVLIKNIYAGVNASDVNISAGRYFTDGKLPFDIGFEGLGIIHAFGKNITNLKVGQPALMFEPRSYAEYVYLKPQKLIPIPALKPEYLGCLVSGLTASIALDKCGEIKSGETVLITAAAGGTGQIAVQWAKQKGCYVIGMTSSDEKAKLLKDLGTDRVINYKTENLDEVLTKEYPSGVDVVWETIGGQVFKTLSKHLKIKGRLVVIGSISGYVSGKSVIDDNIAGLTNNLILHSTSLRGFMLTHFSDCFPQYLPKLIEMVAKNQLKIAVDLGLNTVNGEFKGIDSICRAVEHLHSGKSTGKVVVTIQDQK